MKQIGLLALAAKAQASTFGSQALNNTYTIQDDALNEAALSVEYEANTNFKMCTCDVIKGACDPFCCCDQDCSENVRNRIREAGQCSDESSKVERVGPLSNCLSGEEAYEFNTNRGLTTYYNPYKSLMCVLIDRSPEMAEYYQSPNRTQPTDTEITLLEGSLETNGFAGTALAADSPSNNDNEYSEGMKMKSAIDGLSLPEQYNKAFPLPQPDSFGVCNNFKSAHFKVDDSSSCAQLVDLETDCTSLLNPEFYTSKLQVYKGPGASRANTVSVEVTQLMSFNEATNEYSEVTIADLATQLPSTASQAAGQCTCANYLKEIQYNAKLVSAPSSTSTIRVEQLDTITATVVLGSVTGACGEKVPVNQNFKISFQDSGTPDDAESVSGNPGYFNGAPLKIGYLLPGDQATGIPMQVFEEGLQLTGADKLGACYSPSGSATALTDYDEFVVNFKENITYGCQVSYDATELQTFCEDATSQDTIQALEIFKNLDKFTYFGQWGNPDLRTAADWTAVLEDPSYQTQLGTVEWDAVSNTCKVYSSVRIEVDYASTGDEDDPQQQVLKVQKFGVREDWVAPPAGESRVFAHSIKVSYKSQAETKEDPITGYISPNAISFSKNLFYPAFLRTLGGANLAVGAAAGLSLLVMS